MLLRFLRAATSVAVVALAVAACGGSTVDEEHAAGGVGGGGGGSSSGGGGGGGGIETECNGSVCNAEQVCVGYVTDGGNGTQCMMRPECSADNCACILSELCNNLDATCDASANGTHVANCIVDI